MSSQIFHFSSRYPVEISRDRAISDNKVCFQTVENKRTQNSSSCASREDAIRDFSSAVKGSIRCTLLHAVGVIFQYATGCQIEFQNKNEEN